MSVYLHNDLYKAGDKDNAERNGSCLLHHQSQKEKALLGIALDQIACGVK